MTPLPTTETDNSTEPIDFPMTVECWIVDLDAAAPLANPHGVTVYFDKELAWMKAHSIKATARRYMISHAPEEGQVVIASVFEEILRLRDKLRSIRKKLIDLLESEGLS